MSELFVDYFGSIYISSGTDARSQTQTTIARMNPLNTTYKNVYSALYMLNVSSTSDGDIVYPQELISCSGLRSYPSALFF